MRRRIIHGNFCFYMWFAVCPYCGIVERVNGFTLELIHLHAGQKVSCHLLSTREEAEFQSYVVRVLLRGASLAMQNGHRV